MKTAAIIAEYNPFHNGHAYQLQKVRELSGADFLLIVMSGDFVQRGTPALFNKYIRTEMALCCGADLVLELPCACACGSAPRFAAGAAAILNGLGVVDELWFGSEAGNIEPFQALTEVLTQEPEHFQRKLKEGLQSGLSFPSARMHALLASYSELTLPFASSQELADFLTAPNNILGLEYCLALKKSDSTIQPRTLKRIGNSYHQIHLSDTFSSASAIRQSLWEQGPAAVENQVPETVYPLLTQSWNSCGPLWEDDFSLPLRYQLLKEDADSLCRYLDISPDLARRILRLQNQFVSFSQFAGLLKTKNNTRTNMNRALLHILLGLTKQDIKAGISPSFVRILGMASCQKLLTAIKETGTLLLTAKPGRLPAALYAKDLFASNLYETVSSLKSGRDFVHEYSRHFTIVP